MWKDLLLGAMFVGAYAYVLLNILQDVLDAWYRLSTEEEEEEWSEECVISDEPIEIGDMVYDTVTEEVATYCGDMLHTDNDSYAVCTVGAKDTVRVYRCPIEQLKKVISTGE